MKARTPGARSRLREAALRAACAALSAADCGRAVRHALQGRDLGGARRVLVLAMGKGAVPMTAAAVEVLGERVVGGLCVTKDGHAGGLARLGSVRVATSSHPVPDSRAPAVAREMLSLARSASEVADVALVLLSGGASALAASPPEGVPLADFAALTHALVRSGAGIREINAVRRRLSTLHGGRLAFALGATPSLSLVVSDVVGDDLASISSGPTTPDAAAPGEAEAVLERWLPGGLAGLAPSLRGGLAPAACTPPAGFDWSRHEALVVASLRIAAEAAASYLRWGGFATEVLGTEIADDVAAVALGHVEAARCRLREARTPFALVSGGEPTLRVTGAGLGGRCQHLAAVAAGALDAGLPGEVTLLALATDGTDGPTDAAGGLVDAGTFGRARARGLDPIRCLEAFDSHRLLAAAGDLVVTGPTGTNVMDLHVVVGDSALR